MIGETIVRRRQVADDEDSQGNPTFTVESTDIEGVAFEPTGTSETLDATGRRTVTSGNVYAPSGAVFLPTDQIVIRGLVFTVDGDGKQWTSPYSGTGKGVVVAVKRGS